MGTSDKIKVSTIVPGVIIDETIFEIKATIALPFRSRLTRLVVHVQSFLLFCFAFFLSSCFLGRRRSSSLVTVPGKQFFICDDFDEKLTI